MFTDAPSGGGNIPLAQWDLLGAGPINSSIDNLATFLDGTAIASAMGYGSPVLSAADLDAYISSGQEYVAYHSTTNMPQPCSNYGSYVNNARKVRDCFIFQNA